MEDVEELMKATAENADDGISSLRERIRERLVTAKNTLAQGKRVLETSRQEAEAAVSYAQENPWAMAGIAAGAAVALVGLLWSRCVK